MNEVPSVAYPTGRSFRLGMALVGIWLAGAVAVLAWGLSQAVGQWASLWRLWVVVLALALTGVALSMFWRSQTPRRLAFDGEQWHLTEATLPAVRITIAWDAQRCMLLSWPDAGPWWRPARWLWVDGSIDPYRWHLLRCALYSPANRLIAKAIDDEVIP